MQTIMFNLEPDEANVGRFKITGHNLTTGKGGLLADNLKRKSADEMLNCYQVGGILAGGNVSAQSRYK